MSEKSQSVGHDAGHKDRWYHRKYNNPHPAGSQLHKDYDDAYRGKHKAVMKGFKTFDRTGNEVVKEASALDKFRAAAAEREKEANKREAEMKARHAAGKEDMKGAIDTLAKKMNNEATDLRAQLQKHSDAAIAANKAGDDEKVKLHQNKMNAIKDKMAKQARNEEVELEESHVEFRIDHREKATGDHKSTFASHDAKVSDTTDKATYVKVPSHKADSFKSAMKTKHGVKVELEESRNQADSYWDQAEKHKAEAEKHKVGSSAYHASMADHYDSMHRYHADLGQHNAALSAASKADKHHAKSYEAESVKEEVAANNVGSGNIAGTQGDAGKKVVMTKEPLKRKKLTDFKEWVELDEAAVDAKGHKSSTGGLTQKGVDAYRRENPGSKLQTAVTTPPSKLDPDSKAAKRRKSFCARMSGVEGPMKDEKGRPTRKALALRKWNC